MTKAEKSRRIYNSFNALKELTGALGEFDNVSSSSSSEGYVSAIIWWNIPLNCIERAENIKETYPTVSIVLEKVKAATGPDWNRVTIFFHY